MLTPGKLEELAPELFEFLVSHAGELDLQIAVPNRYDTHLKPYVEFDPEDLEAVGAWLIAHIEYQKREIAKMARLSEFHRSQQTDEDESLTLGEAYERHAEGTARMEELLEGEEKRYFLEELLEGEASEEEEGTV